MGDTGSNYFAVAMAKLAEMLDTFENSGTVPERLVKKGELGYMGRLCLQLPNGLWAFTFFSGGTSKEDIVISQAGMDTFVL